MTAATTNPFYFFPYHPRSVTPSLQNRTENKRETNTDHLRSQPHVTTMNMQSKSGLQLKATEGNIRFISCQIFSDCLLNDHVRWVPCHQDMARPQVADGGDDLQIWRLAANILNNQSRPADKGWSSSLKVGVGLTTQHLKK
jgi:hypothetical protein